jgi:hypothetical protein
MAEKKFLVDINLLFNELKSARIENLATDPTTLYGGLFWFNTTAKALKFSDGTSVYQVAVGNNLDDAIAAAKAYADGLIATEKSDRDGAIASAIQGEVSARDGAILTAIQGEASARDGAILTATESEASARDGAISTAIQGEVSARDGAISTAIQGEAASRTQGDTDTLTAAKTYADSIVGSMSGGFIGDYDASLGTIPSGTTKAGDYWRVSVAGTLAGLSPVEKLEAGDLVVSRVANPTSAADFFSMQGNVSDAVTSEAVSSSSNELAVFSGASGKAIMGSGVNASNLANTFSLASVNLVAGTPQVIGLVTTDSDAALKTSVQVFDGSGDEVIVGVKKSGKTIQISANVAITVSVVLVCPANVTSASVNPVT